MAFILLAMDRKAELQKAQQHLSRHDPKLAELIAIHGDCTLQPHGKYYYELFDSIVSQQLSVKAARSIMNRIQAHYGTEHPKPEKVIETDNDTLRALGLSYAKANYVKDLAQHVIDGRLDLEHIATLDDQEVIDQLVAVKGIGEWTAHMFMMFSLGRLNILAWGDLGIRNGTMKVYGLKKLPVKDDLIKLSKKYHWEPYQTVACWYLWKSLDNTPK